MKDKASSRLAALRDRLSRNGEAEATIGDIVDSAGSAGQELTLAALTVLSLVPGPSALVFGPMILIVAFQAVTGAERLRLPEFIRRRHLRNDLVLSGLDKGVSALQRLENWLGPRRLWPLSRRATRVALALPFLVLSTILTIPLPLPLGNLAPAAGLIALTFALVSEDGVAILFGWIASLAAVAWTTTILWQSARFIDWIGKAAAG